MIRSCPLRHQTPCGFGHENYALPDYVLVSRLLELVQTGTVSEYAPHKQLRQLRPGKLATAMKKIDPTGEKIVLLSPCLADLGDFKGLRGSLQGVVIHSEVRMSRLHYHSRDPRGSHGYWNTPPASADYLYLLSDVRGLSFPAECMLADGQEASAATLVVEETFEIDEREPDLIKLRRRPGIAFKDMRPLH